MASILQIADHANHSKPCPEYRLKLFSDRMVKKLFLSLRQTIFF